MWDIASQQWVGYQQLKQKQIRLEKHRWGHCEDCYDIAEWWRLENDWAGFTICDNMWRVILETQGLICCKHNYTDPLEQNLWVLLEWNYCTGWMPLMSCHHQHQCSSHLALTCRLDDLSQASSQFSAEALSFLAQCTLSLCLGRLLSIFCMSVFTTCLQCFDTVGWAAGRASGL